MSDAHAAVAAVVERNLNLVEGAAARHNVPPALLLGIIHDESGGDPDAFRIEPLVIDASFGLMQLLWGTAKGLGYSGPVRMLFDAALNIELGAQYLGGLLARYKDSYLALIHYNGGPGAVRWYKLGWTRGRAVHYANTVHALQLYYERRLRARLNGP